MIMKSRILRSLIAAVLCILLSSPSVIARELTVLISSLVRKIPPRHDSAMTGSEFAGYVSGMDQSEREEAIKTELIHGNVPDFSRKLHPVHLTDRSEDGKIHKATLFVMPDYLAIGSDNDFLLVPMNLYSADEVAERFGFVLPTRKIVDAIYQQSDVCLAPQPMPAGPRMRSTEYYVKHNRRIKEQRLAAGCTPGSLVSGHKKDVVLTNRLRYRKGQIAIYGWHRPTGIPIQPLSTVHGARYADYSHGIRLVSDTVLIDGEPRPISGVLEDPKLARILSDEGVVKGVRRIFDGLQLSLHRYQNP
jgi:hypothetical protein